MIGRASDISDRRPGGRELSIETLRGIAIVLMVAGHVVGSEPDFAMQVPDDSPWRFVFWGFQDIRMPLFTVISGYIYAMRPPSSWVGYGTTMRAKARRLLVPLLVVGTLLFWTKYVTPGTNSKPEPDEWWRVYFFGMDHLWFLQAVFIIFAIVAVLDVVGVLGRPAGWAIATAAAGLLYILAVVPSVALFSLDGAIRLLPFFLLGYGLRRHIRTVPALVVLLAAATFVAAYVPRLLALYGVVDLGSEQLTRALAVAVGVAAIILLFQYREVLSNRLLAWIGGYSFGIYLFHYFAYSAARIGLRAMGIDSHVLTFVLGMLCGLGLPILLQLAIRRVPTLRLLLLGERRPRDRDRDRSAPRTRDVAPR